ncbi:MAG: hypothetical protein A2Y95_03245 [Deltaproteobacteria bacterium RBG_13_65_10]|nr:MAG: hypothetical protein A2Y95_03245 [Deltaproteobacteria bacterium RBG_13_65_10]
MSLLRVVNRGTWSLGDARREVGAVAALAQGEEERREAQGREKDKKEEEDEVAADHGKNLVRGAGGEAQLYFSATGARGSSARSGKSLALLSFPRSCVGTDMVDALRLPFPSPDDAERRSRAFPRGTVGTRENLSPNSGLGTLA